MHFTRMGSYASAEVPVIVRGEGCYVYDEHGKRYLDGLSALYCVNIGHGRHYADVPPIKGVYRGAASANLEASVTMTRLDRVDPASIARS